MADFGNIVMLFVAIVTCLAVGVVLAYGACNVLFAAMRPRGVVVARGEAGVRQVA